jgi:hypothetical protein
MSSISPRSMNTAFMPNEPFLKASEAEPKPNKASVGENQPALKNEVKLLQPTKKSTEGNPFTLKKMKNALAFGVVTVVGVTAAIFLTIYMQEAVLPKFNLRDACTDAQDDAACKSAVQNAFSKLYYKGASEIAKECLSKKDRVCKLVVEHEIPRMARESSIFEFPHFLNLCAESEDEGCNAAVDKIMDLAFSEAKTWSFANRCFKTNTTFCKQVVEKLPQLIEKHPSFTNKFIVEDYLKTTNPTFKFDVPRIFPHLLTRYPKNSLGVWKLSRLAEQCIGKENEGCKEAVKATLKWLPVRHPLVAAHFISKYLEKDSTSCEEAPIKKAFEFLQKQESALSEVIAKKALEQKCISLKNPMFVHLIKKDPQTVRKAIEYDLIKKDSVTEKHATEIFNEFLKINPQEARKLAQTCIGAETAACIEIIKLAQEKLPLVSKEEAELLSDALNYVSQT